MIKKTALELKKLLDKKEVSSKQIMQSFIERTHAIESKVQSYLSLNEEEALKSAELSDERRAKGQLLGHLDGIPVSLKDILAEEGKPLTCGSKMLENFISPYSSTVVNRLKEQGLIIWGRTNLDEFAMGSSTESSSAQVTSNPWDLDCVPGGSSGGSASAVASGQTPLAIGSDTGGSVRQPAALCGITGFKPTYGLVSRFGLVAYASSLDQVGVFGQTILDSAMLLKVIAGHDKRDSTSCPLEIPNYYEYVCSENKDKNERKNWKIGIPKEYFAEGIDSEVAKSIQDAIAFYKSQGCEIVEISLKMTEYAIPTYYIVSTAEASSNLARFDGIRYTSRSAKSKDAIDVYLKTRSEGFGPEVKRRIILGTFVLSSGHQDAYYLHAQKVRTIIRNDFMDAFEKVDVILTPTSPFPAFKKGEKMQDPISMCLADIYTVSVNLAGLPGVSIPCGFTKSGLPIGLQLIGKPFSEKDLFNIAYKFESNHDYVVQFPPI